MYSFCYSDLSLCSKITVILLFSPWIISDSEKQIKNTFAKTFRNTIATILFNIPSLASLTLIKIYIYICLFIYRNMFIWKAETEEGKNFPSTGSLPQMPTTAGAGPNWNWELVTQSGSVMWVSGTQVMWTCCFLRCPWAGSWNLGIELKLKPRYLFMDVNI